jgi:hypothetical protein
MKPPPSEDASITGSFSSVFDSLFFYDVLSFPQGAFFVFSFAIPTKEVE